MSSYTLNYNICILLLSGGEVRAKYTCSKSCYNICTLLVPEYFAEYWNGFFATFCDVPNISVPSGCWRLFFSGLIPSDRSLLFSCVEVVITSVAWMTLGSTPYSMHAHVHGVCAYLGFCPLWCGEVFCAQQVTALTCNQYRSFSML